MRSSQCRVQPPGAAARRRLQCQRQVVTYRYGRAIRDRLTLRPLLEDGSALSGSSAQPFFCDCRDADLKPIEDVGLCTDPAGDYRCIPNPRQADPSFTEVVAGQASIGMGKRDRKPQRSAVGPRGLEPRTYGLKARCDPERSRELDPSRDQRVTNEALASRLLELAAAGEPLPLEDAHALARAWLAATGGDVALAVLEGGEHVTARVIQLCARVLAVNRTPGRERRQRGDS